MTWEHDAHLYMRRATAIAAVAGAEQAAIEVTDLVRGGLRRAAAIDLPPEAKPIRAAMQERKTWPTARHGSNVCRYRRHGGNC